MWKHVEHEYDQDVDAKEYGLDHESTDGVTENVEIWGLPGGWQDQWENQEQVQRDRKGQGKRRTMGSR